MRLTNNKARLLPQVFGCSFALLALLSTFGFDPVFSSYFDCLSDELSPPDSRRGRRNGGKADLFLHEEDG